jgi:hypothetical protein
MDLSRLDPRQPLSFFLMPEALFCDESGLGIGSANGNQSVTHYPISSAASVAAAIT